MKSDNLYRNKILHVEKSLFDKAVDVTTFNPNLVVNENSKNIKSKVVNKLKSSDRFDIAISYVVWSGLSLINEELNKYDSTSRMIVTTEGFVTCPRSLRKLLELNIDVRVYDPRSNDRGFHLKSYMFYKQNERSLLVGSSNISSRAFGEVHEMVVEINANDDGSIVDKYDIIFNDLWNNVRTKKLTKEFILIYEKLYYQKKHFVKKVHKNYLNSVEIIPNYMQSEALIQLSEYRNDFNKGLVIAATGTGKTYLSAFDVKQFKAKKILFLVHNRTILRSAITTFENIFKNKKILELKTNRLSKLFEYDFVFTTNKTAVKHLVDSVGKNYFDYIIYDEAHKIGENTQYEKIMNYFEPKFTLGMTATPERTDDSEFLFKKFDFCIPYEIRLIDSLNNKLICPFTYYGVDADIEDFKIGSNLNYEEVASFIIDQIKKVGHYDSKLKGIVFCSGKNEARDLSNELTKKGILSKAIVSGDSSINEDIIEEYIVRLQNDDQTDINLLCVVDKFNEGVDIPEVNTIVMLRSTKSSIIFLQQLGRGLRLTSDEHKFVTVIDLIGNSNKNYTIAEALTGRRTVDQEQLIQSTLENFESVSPYINVNIEEIALNKILSSISNSFKAKTIIKNKFNDELSRFEVIPTLKELYLNSNFNELKLLQLLESQFYTAFENHYVKKYNISRNSKFLKWFFALIIQFVFRAYSKNTLKDYSKLLRGDLIENNELSRILNPYDFKPGLYTSIRMDYKKYCDIKNPFIKVENGLRLNDAIVKELEKLNAYELFLEHIELIELLEVKHDYDLKPFKLITKAEFLYHTGYKTLFTMAGQEIHDDDGKVYCPIVVSKEVHMYANYIIDEHHLTYQTQGLQSVKSAEERMNKIKNYKFEIAVQFPHLKYEKTSYYYIGEVDIVNVSDVKEYVNNDGKVRYNHEITFRLDNKIPRHLMLYKE